MPLSKIRLGVAAIILAAACRSEPKRVATPSLIGWRAVASWSGHGNAQPETFTVDSYPWRVRWETSRESPPGAGTFKALVRSADSGSAVLLAADHPGVGRDTTYVAERHRAFYLAIDSSNIDWSVTIEEPIVGQEAR